MCGRMRLTPADVLRARWPDYRLDPTLELLLESATAQAEITPGLQAPAITNARPGWFNAARLGVYRDWKDQAPGADPYLVNARDDRLLRSWGYQTHYHRCIVPAATFFERRNDGRLFAVTPADGLPFALAGLWEIDPRDRQLSVVIVTTSPNAKLLDIHHRMPVVLGRDGEQAWLYPGQLHADDALRLAQPCPPEWLVVRPAPARA